MKRSVRGVKFSAAVFMVLVLSMSTFAGTVSLWSQNATSTWLTKIAKEFTQETGIEVELKQINWATDDLYVATAAGVAPDLFTHGTAALGALAHQGLMAPLDDVAAEWEFIDDVIPIVLDLTRYEGELVAIPYNGLGIENLIYHSLMYEEAGLSSEHPPQSWDDLVAYARKLTRRDPDGNMLRSGLNLQTNGQNPSMWFRLFTLQSGLDPFGSELANLSLTDERIVDSVSFYSDLFHVHGVNEPGRTGSFGAGTTAMQYDRVRAYEELLGDEAQYMRVALFPYNKVPVTTFVGDYIALSPKAPNREEAILLLEYIMHPDRQYEIAKARGTLPIFLEGINWDFVQATPVYPTAINLMLEYGHVSTPNPTFFELRDLQNQVMRAVTDPTRAPRVVLEEYNAAFREIAAQ